MQHTTPPSIALPGAASCAAVFTFDVDGESAALAASTDARHSLTTISHQAYGPLVGVRRILDILDSTATRSTFFVPGYTAELHPGVVRDIVSAGHEVAHHGYHHVRPTMLTVAEQISEIERGADVLEALGGKRPRGYRAPMWDLSWEMPRVLVDRGFLYDSSLMDGDGPYLLETRSSETDSSSILVEIPIHWALDDWEQYCYLPGITELGPIQTPEQATALWRSELEGVRRFGGAWVLTNHPFLSGRPGRASALEALIRSVQEMPDVWVTTMEDLADCAIAQLSEPRRMLRLLAPDPE